MKKKVLAWILTALMFIQCIPMNVFALDEVIYLENESYTYVNPEYRDIVDEDDFSSHSYYNVPEFAVDYSDYLSEVDDLAAVLRNGMKNRESSIILYYTTPYDGSGTFSVPWDAIWDTATAHSDDPKGGDYISHNGTGYNAGTNSAKVVNGDVYCYIIWNVRYFTTAEQEAEVDAEVDRVLGEIITEGMDDYQKVKAIYDYICANVTYDYANLNDSSYTLKHSAYAALINKTAVCQGYALLFYRMALEVGIDARYISGIGNGGPHGWNIVELEDLYYNLDSTWDAGESTYSYFLRSNENFVNHSRDSEYNTTAFILKYPMGTEDYVYMGTPAVSNECGDGVEWNFDSETGTLYINYTGSGSGKMNDYTYVNSAPWKEYSANISSCVVGSGVTIIGNYAFYEMAELTNVIMPESLVSLGDYSFYRCPKLITVNIPNGVTTLGESVFSNSRNLSTVVFPDSLTTIKESAFCWCDSLVNIELPNSLKTIGEYAFNMCISLTDVVIPEGVTTIGNSAFAWCDKLENVELPSSLSSLGSCAFYNCFKLKSVTFAGNVPSSLGKFLFSETATIYYNKNASGWTTPTWIAPDGIVYNTNFIGNYSGECGDGVIWELNLDTGVLNISYTGSGSGKIDDYVTWDPAPWSEYNEKITKCIIGEGVTSIGVKAFEGCSLSEVSLPSSLISIGDWAFYGCESLNDVTFPDGIVSIGTSAFLGTGVSEITIPASLTTIGASAFLFCNSLTKVTFKGNVPSTWGADAIPQAATIYYNEGATGWTSPTWTAPDGMVYNTKVVAQIIASGNCGAQGDNVKWKIDSAGTLTIFGEGEMNEYQESLGVPWLHKGPNFQDLYESIITNVVIEEGVTLISSNIFCDCEELLTIHIPKSVVLIGEGVVCSCDKLVYIYVDADNMNYTSVDGVLFTKNMKTLHTYPTGLNPQEYIVPETVQRIGRRAFYGCESLENIYLPNGLITIGEGAFSSCSGLTEVNIPNGVTTIEHSAFSHCSGLTNVTLPSELITLEGFSFAYCRNIVNILLPNKLHEIGNEAFMRCSGLLNIIIPKSVTSLGYCAFDYCDNLSTVIFESNVPLIWGNEYFVSYVIPQTATIYYNEGTIGWTSPTWTAPDGMVYNTVMIEAPEPENKQGDIDGNGTVDVDDVLICLDLAFVTPSEEQLKLADLDKDGDVDVDDVLICLDLCFA